MSEEFEVKGPHEEVLEGGESHTSHKFNSRLAVMTAIMAAMGALLSYKASLTLGEAIIYKNEAAINKTEAADQWNYYQAKSNSERYLHVHHSWATGATALQIAISLAAIALLTRRKWLEYFSLFAAAVGIGFGALAGVGF